MTAGAGRGGPNCSTDAGRTGAAGSSGALPSEPAGAATTLRQGGSQNLDAITLLLLPVGFALLVAGAELLVRGAARLAALAGLSPLLIGLTVVACGTSTPELAVNLRAAWRGQPDLALGNAVGSNIFNVLAILGFSAIVAPLTIVSQVIRRDLPVMIGSALVVAVLGGDGRIDRADGMILVAAMVVYTVASVVLARREGRDQAAGNPIHRPPWPESARLVGWQLLLIAAGLGMLVVGTGWVVHGAAALARAVGVGELIIGLTIVAAGTSLPELVTSVVSTIRGQREIAVGNVVGSNIFNVLGILGVSGLICSIEVAEAALWFDIPVMIGVSLLCLPLFMTGGILSRWEGLLFLGYYAAYTVYLVLDGLDHAAFPAYRTAMLLFVVPATVLATSVTFGQWIRSRPKAGGQPGETRPAAR